jgi:phenylalanyl-tRNA synthetase alpha chain
MKNKSPKKLDLNGLSGINSAIESINESNQQIISLLKETVNDSVVNAVKKLADSLAVPPLTFPEIDLVKKLNEENQRNFALFIEDATKAAKNIIDSATLWRNYLGHNSQLAKDLKSISSIEPSFRKDFAQQKNTLKTLESNIANRVRDDKKSENQSDYLSKKLINLDHKKAKVGHLHPLTETINEINNIFRRLGYSVYDGPEIETYEFNFERCNVPADHPALDLQDSIYIEEPNILLRTQTSSIEARALQNLKPPFKIVMPGRTYRNEKVNRSNHFTFHQYQLVCVQEKVSMAELISTIEYLFKNFLGDVLGEDKIKTRYRNKYYPEVEPGVGPDLQCWMCDGKGCGFCKHRGWVEMGGSGIIHPNIMRMAGLDTDKWQGYAFGLGLDRWAMAKHGIEDIRTLLGGNLAYKPNVR